MPETFASFEEYFESRMGQPFSRWVELENTYQFAQKYAPELLKGGYEDARAKIAELDAKDQIEQEARPIGTNQYSEGVNNINTLRPAGTSQQAGLRRLRKSAPELYQQVLNGELSVHFACVQAGFRKPTVTVPVDPERASPYRAIRMALASAWSLSLPNGAIVSSS